MIFFISKNIIIYNFVRFILIDKFIKLNVHNFCLKEIKNVKNLKKHFEKRV